MRAAADSHHPPVPENEFSQSSTFKRASKRLIIRFNSKRAGALEMGQFVGWSIRHNFRAPSARHFVAIAASILWRAS